MLREQFLNWLTFCDNRYADLIKDVEQLETMTTIESLEDDVKDLARKLYSILASYLQGPALQIVRAFSTDRHGFAVWHRLKELYAPRARPRALAIGQAIMQHPSFSQQRSMLENLLQFDSLLDHYELAAGHRMPDDLTVGTVLRCLDGTTRRHLEMIMDDSMDYAKLKEKLIILDKNTKACSGDNFLKNLQLMTLMNQPTTSSSTSYQGPAPMEVDQVQFGSEGKTKRKGRFKRKESWFGFPYGGRHGGGSKGGRKGIAKSKGKEGGKGTKSVRLVKMYHVATPPAESPEIFELRSDMEEEEFSVRMDEADEALDGNWASDPLMDWYRGKTSLDWNRETSNGPENMETLCIRMVNSADQLVVLDSGADISLLPYHMSGYGVEKQGGRTVLEDAQGERLKTLEGDQLEWNVKV
eukprot:s1657_g17.t1